MLSLSLQPIMILFIARKRTVGGSESLFLNLFLIDDRVLSFCTPDRLSFRSASTWEDCTASVLQIFFQRRPIQLVSDDTAQVVPYQKEKDQALEWSMRYLLTIGCSLE